MGAGRATRRDHLRTCVETDLRCSEIWAARGGVGRRSPHDHKGQDHIRSDYCRTLGAHVRERIFLLIVSFFFSKEFCVKITSRIRYDSSFDYDGYTRSPRAAMASRRDRERLHNARRREQAEGGRDDARRGAEH